MAWLSADQNQSMCYLVGWICEKISRLGREFFGSLKGIPAFLLCFNCCIDGLPCSLSLVKHAPHFIIGIPFGIQVFLQESQNLQELNVLIESLAFKKSEVLM